ncbi:NTF2 fold immunity protein [Chryseobacterium sp. T20]|uniref:NTF2 fold immunity protein n=1 Tax=Chryseobacterium sp. T20 TaxID=3395375 RepID=UPI0039BD7733
MNKEIAISIAEKKWKQVYGNSAINKQKPFVTERKNDSIWIVQGNFPSPPKIGGVAYAEVNIKTKKVVKYTHGE